MKLAIKRLALGEIDGCKEAVKFEPEQRASRVFGGLHRMSF